MEVGLHQVGLLDKWVRFVPLGCTIFPAVVAEPRYVRTSITGTIRAGHMVCHLSRLDVFDPLPIGQRVHATTGFVQLLHKC